jgi:hypothetical protein
MANVAYGEVDGCTVGDDSQGYWQMISAPHQEECIIPGAPHPDSGFLHYPGNNNGAFRIEGKYKVVTVLTAWGFACSPGECPSNTCISGFREWMCNDVYESSGMYMEDSLCIFPGGCGGGNAYACFTDINAVTLYEWVCKSQPPEPPEKNKNQGPPCPPGQCCN